MALPQRSKHERPTRPPNYREVIVNFRWTASHPTQGKNSRIVIDFSPSFVYDKIVKNGILRNKREKYPGATVYSIIKNLKIMKEVFALWHRSI